MNKNAKMRVGLALPVALLMAANSWGAEVAYIDKDGLEKKQDCTVLTADNVGSFVSNKNVNLGSGCYVVQGGITLTDKRLISSGNIDLILADGAKLTVNYQGNDAFAVGANDLTNNWTFMRNLTVYGQRNQTGSMILSATGGNSGNGRGIHAYNLVVNGGTISVSSGNSDAICATGDITINGGSVNAVTNAGSGYYGIKSGCHATNSGSITVNWADTLKASSYLASGKTITLLSGLTFKDENGNSYSGTNPSGINGKKLTPDYLITVLGYQNGTANWAHINGEYTGSKSVTEVVDALTEKDVVAIDFNRKFTVGIPSTVVLPFSLPSGTEINAKFFSLDSVYQDGCKWRASMSYIGNGVLPQANTPYAVITEGTKLSFNLNGKTATFLTENINTAKVSNENWWFVGTYAYKVWNSESDELGLAYGFAGTNEGQITKGKFGKIALDATDPAKIPSANPLRAYLRKASSNVQLVCSTSNGHPAARGESATFAGIPETIDVDFIENGENGEHTTFVGRLNTRTGEFQMNRDYDLKGRKVNNAPKAHGAYYGKKVLKK